MHRIAACLFVLMPLAAARADAGAAADRILRAADSPGGIALVLGAADAKLPLALAEKRGHVVRALYEDADALAAARDAIGEAGRYGQVSADILPGGRLPHADRLLNLIVVDGWPASRNLADPAEVFRCLAPGGAAFFGDSRPGAASRMPPPLKLLERLGKLSPAVHVLPGKDSGVWVRAVRPWPATIDEWGHALHGADGNPVAHDSEVGPPRRTRWISRPLWLKSHETDSSVRALVTAGGRLFYIVDNAPTSLAGDNPLPDKWSLTARDAFNGVKLWSVPVPDWGWRVWKTSWFTPRPGDIPLNIAKRLVATDRHVYATLGYRAAVTQLDANTGGKLRTYGDTERTCEILHKDGLLYLSLLRDEGVKVAAVSARTGERRWITSGGYKGVTTDYYRWRAMRGSVRPAKVDPTLNTATDGRVVALLDGLDVVCLDAGSGKELWRTPFEPPDADRRAGRIDATTLWVGTLIVADGVVVHASPHKLAGFSAETGKVLWSQPKSYLGHLWYAWKDVFVIDGRVWTWSAKIERGSLPGKNRRGKPQRTSWPASVNGYDLHSGELTRQVDLANIFRTHHHHRCYRNKATDRYILASRRGTEFVDLTGGAHTVHNWVRGTCHLGMMPANGLHYAPPHPCACYLDEKLKGMNALAAAPDDANDAALLAGPAAVTRGAAQIETDAPAAATDWPTYRHDAARSGAATTAVPDTPRELWQVGHDANAAAPIVAAGRVVLPLPDAHQLICRDAATGELLWRHTAGGRIDSPPTYHAGRLIFGCRDGTVTCLRAGDGGLAWRTRPVAGLRRIAAFGQIESAWPVHGSVLVLPGKNGGQATAYAAAGRSSHLDGGMVVCGLDAATGRQRYRRHFAGPWYDSDSIELNYRLPQGVLPDVLQAADGKVFMRDLAMDRELKAASWDRRPKTHRLRPRGGFLDSEYFKRMQWTLTSGVGGYGRLIVQDAEAAFVVRMFDSLQGLNPDVYFVPGQKGYMLLAAGKEPKKPLWQRRIDIRVRAMLVTPGALVVAGPPDVVDPEDPLGAFEGRKGGLLAVIDRDSGKELSRMKLPAPPAFDALAAAGGRLYLTLDDGRLICLGQ